MKFRVIHGCLLLLLALLSACAHRPARNPLAEWVSSPNQDIRRPSLIVIHFTSIGDTQESLDVLRSRNSGGPVSAHYLIGEDGKRYQLVSDERRAWHAGSGSWGTILEVNSASIGIELDNDGHSPYTDAQIQSLIVLLDDLCTRWRIPRTQIIGHSDLAPGRKVDPGPLFPWKRLYEAGFGIWPEADAPPAPEGFDPWTALRLVGYSLKDPAAAVQSFKHRFRGAEGTELDAEDLRILHSLTRPREPLPRVPYWSPATEFSQTPLVDIRTLAPDIGHDIRYYGEDNFVGTRVDGYEAPKCYLLRSAAEALARVQASLRAQGYRLHLFDCYRPQRAVNHFIAWSKDLADTRTKARQYPNLDKSVLLGDYIAPVSGHSRGATVDLTLAKCEGGVCTLLDMGTDFDFFDVRAHTDTPGLSQQQVANRKRLLDAMAAEGFANYPMEWWHFTLSSNPANSALYDVPVR